jgi:peroxiredoxin
MSHRIEEKQARRAERLRLEAEARKAERRQALIRRGGYAAVAAIAAVLVTLAATLGGSSTDRPPVTSAPGGSTGFEVGQKAPDFALTDAVSGKGVSLASLRGSKTMLFFSEGVYCQACMVQAADLERGGELAERDIELVHVSTDDPLLLSEAAGQYGIATTPLLSDPSTEMSAAYGMLGHGGMGHPNTNGHAFMLLDEDGEVLWHRAYQEMYVKTPQLISDMKEALRS